MSVEFKVVSGNTNVLLLINGKGIPAQVVQPKQRDSNELYRFLIRDDRLRELLPERTCRMKKLERDDGMDPANKCLSCGFETTEYNVRFCPNCGARVKDQ